MLTGLLFTTEDIKKDKLQVPQRNEMLSLFCPALGFISKMKIIIPNKVPNGSYLKNLTLQKFV